MAVATAIEIEIKGTCASCQHWDINTNEYDDVGVCLLAMANDKKAHETESYEGMGMASETLFTQWFFGCNQHEPKETETAKENH